MLKSQLCSHAQLDSTLFRRWVPQLGEDFKIHRKLWEFCYITQALYERGMLKPGMRGLGFGVGKEPLTSFFASKGCNLVATDLAPGAAQEQGWANTDQHATLFGDLNDRSLCTMDQLFRQVTLRHVDMRDIPDDLRDFDFTWSSCVFEHLGSIQNGKQFIYDQMKCLRPGGIAVHTTEFNLSSDVETLDYNDFVVLFRRRDIREIARHLTLAGHHIRLDLRIPDTLVDNFVDFPPFRTSPHLRLVWDRYITTSVGLIVQKDEAGVFRPLFVRLRNAMAVQYTNRIKRVSQR